MRLPEEAGIGATPARRANLASEARRLAPAVSARSLAAGEGAAALERRAAAGAWALTRAPSSRSSSDDPAGATADLEQTNSRAIAGPACPARRGRACERPDRARRARSKATGRQLQLGPEVVQVPAQPALVFRASFDEILAVVEQELHLQGRPRRDERRAGSRAPRATRPWRPPGRRSDRTCPRRVRRGDFGPSASGGRGPLARQWPPGSAPAEPETWRQSSIAQIRSSSRSRPQSRSSAKAGLSG